jgi:hypothetical protein
VVTDGPEGLRLDGLNDNHWVWAEFARDGGGLTVRIRMGGTAEFRFDAEGRPRDADAPPQQQRDRAMRNDWSPTPPQTHLVEPVEAEVHRVVETG